MIVGFTGTRHGMTSDQKETLRRILVELLPDEFHHGDCVGADDQACAIAAELLVPRRVAHPPDRNALRARSRWSTVSTAAKEYKVRDRDIVEACNVLVACPLEPEFKAGSGTWYTINHAKRSGKTVIIIYPDGDSERT